MNGFRFAALVLAMLMTVSVLGACSPEKASATDPLTVCATANFDMLEKGKIEVELDASADSAGATVTAEYVRAGGEVQNSWSTAVDLKKGVNTVTVEVGTDHTVTYGDSLVLRYTLKDGQSEQFARMVMDLDLFDKMSGYLNTLSGTVASTGIDKGYYAQVTALCLAEYHRSNDLRKATVKSLESSLQSYSRVLCSMAVLVDYGAEHDISQWAAEYNTDLFADYEEFKTLFDKMMNIGCAAAIDYAGKDVENFSVKELAVAFCLAREHFSKKSVDAWAASLCQVQPDFSFFSHADLATNRNGYIIGGEQLRAWLGLADQKAVTELIDTSLNRQMSHFDENGMYRDNYDQGRELNPALYDLTTRVQLQLVLGFGYEGEKAQELDEILRKGGMMTLFTTSVNGELPYGGRSNQYLFNAALISANCEYEASRYAAENNMAVAGAFKRTAHKAIDSISEYLAANKHIMNFYTDSKIGTEDYGNYDKYMVTMSSFLAIAYLFADDSIEESPSPMEQGGYVMETSDLFSSVCANAGGYSIQILTDADLHYDSVGLGRIHKADVYSALALSMSMSKTPTYTMPEGTVAKAVSLSPLWWNGAKQYRLADAIGLKHTLQIIREDSEAVEFCITYEGKVKGISGLKEHYLLTAEGLKVTVTAIDPVDNKVGYMVPLLYSNGDSEAAGTTEIQNGENGFSVILNGQTYTVTTDAETISMDNSLYGNRNGTYRLGLLEKTGDTITINFRLDE